MFLGGRVRALVESSPTTNVGLLRVYLSNPFAVSEVASAVANATERSVDWWDSHFKPEGFPQLRCDGYFQHPPVCMRGTLKELGVLLITLNTVSPHFNEVNGKIRESVLE